MKKLDLYLASAMCFIALVWFLIEYFTLDEGQIVDVYINNECICSYDLNVDNSYELMNNGQVIANLVIKNGHADISYASCPDKYCVSQSKISKAGETIVCLPNKLVVEISNKDEIKDEYDAIAY